MNLKRLLSIILCTTILLPLLSACGGNNVNEAETSYIDDVIPDSVESTEEVETTSSQDNTVTEKEDNEDKGVFVNIDANSVTFRYLETAISNNLGKQQIEEKAIFSFVDQYKGSGVTDLSFNIFTQISMTPSDVWMTTVDKYLQTTENGYAVDYKEELQMCYTFLEEYGVDYTGVWIDRCNEIGITPWLNVRMNDAHNDGFDNPYFLRDDFFYEADHLPASYWSYQNCYDYADERVRQRMLDYIEEQILRYDAHLELDFSRAMSCFDYVNNPDCHLIMTQFLRDVKEIVESAEEKWGHDIKILIRLIRDIEHNKAFGFDVEAMADEQLVDIVCITPRFNSNDSDMPVAEWKERFPNILIYAGLEAHAGEKLSCDTSLLYAYSAQYLAQEADKIYLYNYFSYPRFPAKPAARLENIYKNCGSPSRLEKQEKRYVVLYQDIYPQGYTPYDPLPANAYNFSLDISTAPILEKDRVTLIVGIDNNHTVTADNLSVKIGGVECEFGGNAIIHGTDYAPEGTVFYKYTFDTSELVGDIVHTIEITTDDPTMGLLYLELHVKP